VRFSPSGENVGGSSAGACVWTPVFARLRFRLAAAAYILALPPRAGWRGYPALPASPQ